jgi:hypothetical protein
MEFTYSFKKEKEGHAYMVEMKKGNESMFVCWLYKEDVQPKETRAQAVDRTLIAAGYEGRQDFWYFKGGN